MANPKRDLPRAMEATILIVLVLYMGVALAVVSSVSADELQTSGLTISAVLALIMINFLSLTTVASLGGATTLLVYLNYGVRVKCQSGLTDIVGIVLLQVESKGRFQSGCDR